MNLRTLVSDNIERFYGDRTTTGTITSVVAGVELEQMWRRGTYQLEYYGGLERLEAESISTENIYRIETDFIWQLKELSTFQVSLGTSGETRAFESVGLDSAREFTEITTTQLIWSTESNEMDGLVNLEHERLIRDDEDSRQLDLLLDFSWPVYQQLDFIAEGVFLTGREQISGDEWDGQVVTLKLEKATDINTTITGEIFGGQTTTRSEATHSSVTLDRLGARFLKANQITPTWYLRTVFGMEGIESDTSSMKWDPIVNILATVQTDERTEISLNAGYELSLFRGDNAIPEWAKTLSGRTSIDWAATRFVDLNAEIEYVRSDFPSGQVTPEHIEEQWTGRTALEWQTSESVLFNLSLMHDRIDNELNQDPLRENILELTVLATF